MILCAESHDVEKGFKKYLPIRTSSFTVKRAVLCLKSFPYKGLTVGKKSFC